MNIDKYKVLQPIDDKVVIKKEKTDSKTSGGLILPESTQDNAKYGIIVAVGPGLKEMTSELNTVRTLNEIKTYNEHVELKRIGMMIKNGDRVLYSTIHGQKFNFDDEDLIIQRESEILCIINK